MAIEDKLQYKTINIKKYVRHTQYHDSVAIRRRRR